MNEYDKMMTLYQRGHTRFQIERFIIAGNGITDWGCFQQCLRELASRTEALEALESQMADLRAECYSRGWRYRLRRWIRWLVSPNPARARARVDHALKGLAARVDSVRREWDRFFGLAQMYHGWLVQEHGDLTPDVCEGLDVDFHRRHLEQQIGVAQLCGQPLNPALLQTIAALPGEQVEEVIAGIRGGDYQRRLLGSPEDNGRSVVIQRPISHTET